MRWREYPRYKPSGVEWLEKVPEQWELKPLKRIFITLNGSTPKSSEPDYWDGDIPWATPDDLGNLIGDTLQKTRRMITQKGYKSCGTSLAPAGSLVLSTRAPIGHLAIAGVPMCTNQGCRCLVFLGKAENRFYYYQLLAAKQELESWGKGSTFKELNRDRLTSIYLASPHPNEQSAIAVFLERETGRIDALIEKKQRQIELLQEKRAALISHAVTKGLDPNMPMKDSGVEWLGKIPAHWQVMKLKYLAVSLQTGPFGSQLHADEYVDDGIPAVNPANIQNGKIFPDWKCCVDEETFLRLNRHRLKEGDIVFARRGEMGRCALVTDIEDGWLCGTGSIRIRLNKINVYPKFIHYVLSLEGVRDWLSLESVGSTMENLNTEIISRIPVSLPPVQQQIDIALFVEYETTQINSLIAKIQESIDRLKEYRTALISAAVTGKIDVREEMA